MSEEKKKQIWHRVRMALVVLFAGICALICRGLFWMLTTWNNLTVDEIFFHLKAPLSGTDANIIWGFILTCLLPALLVMAAAGGILFWFRSDRRKYRIAVASVCGVGLLAAAVGVINVWVKLDLTEYIKKQTTFSTFIEDHYVDPDDVEITFPRKKRNLIYIYLESMEVTYADKENGGAFEENYIPNLTALAQKNEDFSGRQSALNGGTALYNTTWTVAAMFAQSSGLPLTIPLLDNQNAMSTQSNFFPSVTALGDILDREGYHNALLLGSDVSFGGRKQLFSQHGDYELWDYGFAENEGDIPEGYKVFWGYEDEKLFSIAREKLGQLAAADEPFNLTMLTVDTHFEDGYVCDLCGREHGDDQYANVISCSDRQVTDFVAWVQQQPFYENTTIVIVGDHPTMDIDFCKNVTSEYDRKIYTVYINSPVKAQGDAARSYSTFDLFPTTLAALGVTIPGDRLGLGTNLYADVETLVETYGIDHVNQELKTRSHFMDQLTSDISQEKEMEQIRKEEEQKKYEEMYKVRADVYIDTYDPETQTISVKVDNITAKREIKAVNCAVWTKRGSTDLHWYGMDKNEDGYKVALPLSDFSTDFETITIHIYAKDSQDENQYITGVTLESLEELPFVSKKEE